MANAVAPGEGTGRSATAGTVRRKGAATTAGGCIAVRSASATIPTICAPPIAAAPRASPTRRIPRARAAARPLDKQRHSWRGPPRWLRRCRRGAQECECYTFSAGEPANSPSGTIYKPWPRSTTNRSASWRLTSRTTQRRTSQIRQFSQHGCRGSWRASFTAYWLHRHARSAGYGWRTSGGHHP